MPDAADQRGALLNERNEINLWNRHILQLYYGWFTVFITANVLAQAWLVQYSKELSTSRAKAVFISFAISNGLGIVAAVRLMGYARESSLRIDRLNDSLIVAESETRLVRPNSTIPIKSIKVGYVVSSIAMIIFGAIWSMMVMQ
jgi:hypothetical protein